MTHQELKEGVALLNVSGHIDDYNGGLMVESWYIEDLQVLVESSVVISEHNQYTHGYVHFPPHLDSWMCPVLFLRRFTKNTVIAKVRFVEKKKIFWSCIARHNSNPNGKGFMCTSEHLETPGVG
ncbi:hypothetical protein Y032_0959g3216 [Ancylostoma ceylanicum]|uniref:Uncharacterized protein n=1 Tax=Ancylostoma ceylanicum TaxID=53326 RepID=A0A016W8G8_9BILA|nr:hypothetical protein Y032_0959g3216 [Ancylostoma ceylanicum]